ncbi:DUF3040 family protein [Microcella alkaliphila]|uniref:DUF3040 family protein n=1 Tax=Microcella alkaliphila TaxID=279828 RepID=A0A4Q7TTI6_9MICO|nr:DUF3040 domain-containing protein [Microcella alkaliphila]RZT64295.1 DUF3040 family protein [Microcella alkaliphila]
MPLSEQEQRLLEEMERNLYRNDADFVSAVSGRRGKPNYTLVTVGALLAVVGIGVLVTGVVISIPLVGVLGFAVMFGGVLLALTPAKGSASSAAPEAPAAARTNRSSWTDRMNERWERRQEGER